RRSAAVRHVCQPCTDPGRHRRRLALAVAALGRRSGDAGLADPRAPAAVAAPLADATAAPCVDPARTAAGRRLCHARSGIGVAARHRDGSPMNALDIIAAAGTEPCNPWPRHVLSRPDWAAMAGALAAG